MPVMEYLERNARLYPDEVALVELNPDENDTRRMTWKEYALIQPTRFEPYRREITWSVFNEKANRFANMLIGRGIKKGDKVAIIMYNCLEWLHDECSIPVKKSEHGANCPICGSFFNQEHADRKPAYCETCGCRLDWSEL